MKVSLLTLVALLLAACATAHKISAVHIGMTKQEVVAVMGAPTSTSARGSTEYLNYALSETDDDAFRGWTKPYFVRLVNGKVDAYGRMGDFDSTKTPTVRLETDEKVRQDVTLKGNGDLYTELKKLKELKDSGVITEAEFQNQKKKLLDKH